MSNLEKLKKKAADFEQKKQYDRALEIYVQVVEQAKSGEDRDVPLYNRIGDLNLRLGRTEQAVTYYEQAVDLYAEGGYLNNAIALCNKILRHAPSRNSIYYKLGKISAQKGFNSDAKKNFLEYADRMHKLGRTTDAFKALEEFADLCPGQDDIRLMLAEQLARAGKKEEAVEQLQILHVTLDAEGRVGEAEATVERMRALDPNVTPRRSNTPRSQESGGLVFLDLEPSPAERPAPVAGLELTSLEPAPRAASPPPPPPSRRSPVRAAPPVVSDVPLMEELEVAADIDIPAPVADIEDDPVAEGIEITPLEGLEPTADTSTPAFADSLPGVESALEGISSDADDSLTIDLPLAAENYDELVSNVEDTSDPLAGLLVLEDDRADRTVAATGGHEIDELEILPAAFDAEPESDPEWKPESKPGPEPEREPEREPEPEPEPELEPELVASSWRGDEPVVESLEIPLAAEAVLATDAEPIVEPAAEETEPVEVESLTDEGTSQVELESVSNEDTAVVTDEVEDDVINEMVAPTAPDEPELDDVPPPAPVTEPRRKETAPVAPVTAKQKAAAGGDDDFVDLADWLREDTGPRSTRMIATDEKRVGDEQADFADMLEKFKAGVAANVEDEDFDSHYDLGVAYREMGLLDEAISEFQKALRGSTNRIRAYEALGQCFIDREEHEVAVTLLSRGLREPGLEDEELIGVLYLLGFASEEMGHVKDAASYYQRVFAIDIDFRDVRKRLGKASKAASR